MLIQDLHDAFSDEFPDRDTEAKFCALMTQAAERLFAMGKFVGTTAVVELVVDSDLCVTLPSGYEAVLSMRTEADNQPIELADIAVRDLPGSRMIGGSFQAVDLGGDPEPGTTPRASSLTVSETAPSSPQSGDEWIRESTGIRYTYIDSAWAEL